MSAIRPDLPAVQSQTPSPVRSAQAAFFRAAMDQVNTVQLQTTPVETSRPRTSAPAPSDTGQTLRPGSLLDIRV